MNFIPIRFPASPKPPLAELESALSPLRLWLGVKGGAKLGYWGGEKVDQRYG